jgi:peptidyl-tRNA hydrolase, PTH2 family
VRDRPVDLNTTFIYIIDSDLGMSKGKIAAQISHVAMMLADIYGSLGRAIVLKAPHEKFVEIFNTARTNISWIRDAGLTEVPPGTMTCIGFMQTEETRKITKDLKLV